MIHLLRLYVNNFKQLQEIELRFSPHARILVQGKNEAGKSTLFEAVFFGLFGAAIATEGSSRNLDTLIAYDKEKARVELEVESGERVFKIARTIIRDKPNQWSLDIARPSAGSGQAPSGVVEEIRGNAVVNQRLIDELGFDGDALLNTCFVEQKKLEKLEGMTKPKREESLAKLLNLDALVNLEGELKIRAEDKQGLERFRKRAELADVQSELPTRQTELEAAESKLALIDLRGAVEGAANEQRAIQSMDGEIRELAARRDAAAERVERMNQLREAMLNVKDARDALERAEEGEQETQRFGAEYADASRAAEDATSLQGRAQSLRRLLHHVQRLDQIRATGDSNAQRAELLSTNVERISELSAAVAADEKATVELENRLRAYEIGEALGEWIGAKGAKAGEIGESEAGEKRAARDKIARRLRAEVYGLAAFLLITIIVAANLQSPISILPALLVLVVLAVRASALWRDLARASEELGRAEGEAHVRGEAGAEQITRLEETQARLIQLGVAIPESVDLAQARRVMIAREMNNRTKEESRIERDAVRERLLNARAVLGELTRQSQIANVAEVEGETRASSLKVRKSKEILVRWEPRVEKIARGVGIATDTSTVQRAVFQIEAQLEQSDRRVQDAVRLKEEIARREEQARAMRARARESYEKARAVKPDALVWNPSLTLDDYNAFGKELRTEYDGLGGEAALKEAREIEGELGRKQGERESRERNAAVLIAQVQELLGETRDKAKELRELEELGGKLRGMDLGDEAELRARHRELVGQVRSLQDQQMQLEKELGLNGESLNREECRAEYSQAARQQQVRERGAEIVQLSRRRVMQKVLPATMDYMQRILPTLTRDRYADARLDEETFKIQVWDERGGGYKEKNIFSGGTRDQFSLALRLAFALATLPQERGSAPSFIFLDEPLGSFDSERADALIYLLTEGEIARAFDQIFLISHVHVDERLFTNRVVMESGKVAYTDLDKA